MTKLELNRLQTVHSAMLAEYNATQHQWNNAVMVADFLRTRVDQHEAALAESYQAIVALRRDIDESNLNN